MPEAEITFSQWLHIGGDYVVFLGAICAAATAICVVLWKGYRKLTEPAREAAERSEAGDRELHKRVDDLETKHHAHGELLANDYSTLNMIKRELDRQAEATAMLTEGVYLIIQHMVTDDHVPDMEEWMRGHAKASVASRIKP